MKNTVLAFALVAVGLAAVPALADVIPLADGRTLQGEILSGQTTDEGLAVRIFDTGGVVVLKWKHVLEERAKQLRVEYAIDLPENEGVAVAGHVVTMTNGTQVTGVALNLDDYQARASDTLRLKTPAGVQTYNRAAVGGVAGIEIEALEAYTVAELYELKRDENPPDSAAAHFALGDFCQRIGDHVHAKEHYEEAKKDPDFVATNDGKSLDQRLARTEILIRAAGAQEIAQAINRAIYSKKWNEALEQLKQLDADFQDPKIRDAVGYDRLVNRVVRGRDEYFKRRVQMRVYDVMDDLIGRKVREKKPLRADQEGTSLAGSLGGARQWAVRELPTELWDRVGKDLGLEKDEMDRYWSDRVGSRAQTGYYGTGSFIVIKRATLPGGDKPRRPPPGSRRRDSSGGGAAASNASRPKSDEEWWDAVRPADRAKWIEAYFVENSGIFEIIRTDEADTCANCAGKGFLAAVGPDGGDSQNACPQCNTSGKFRKVLYR